MTGVGEGPDVGASLGGASRISGTGPTGRHPIGIVGIPDPLGGEALTSAQGAWRGRQGVVAGLVACGSGAHHIIVVRQIQTVLTVC